MRTSLAVFALLSAIPAFAAPTYGSGSTYGSVSGSGSTYGSGSGSSYGSGSGSGSGSNGGAQPPPTAEPPSQRNDGAAVIYKAQKLKGTTSPTDYTPLPTDGGCFDLSSLYGNWESKTRSLVVQKGYKCDFYTQTACPTTVKPLCLKASNQQIKLETLPAAYDSKIASVRCEKIKTQTQKPKEPVKEPVTPKEPSSGHSTY